MSHLNILRMPNFTAQVQKSIKGVSLKQFINNAHIPQKLLDTEG